MIDKYVVSGEFFEQKKMAGNAYRSGCYYPNGAGTEY